MQPGHEINRGRLKTHFVSYVCTSWTKTVEHTSTEQTKRLKATEYDENA